MSKLLDSLQQENSKTSNGALTNSTSLNGVLDMFFLSGASREMDEKSIINVFVKAYNEDKLLTMKCLFWARDVRGGAGERRFFRIIWNYLKKEDKEKYRELVPFFGRWDDLMDINNKEDLIYISNILKLKGEGIENYSLLCKWFPRKGPVFNTVRKLLGLSPKELRRIIVDGTEESLTERKMSKKEWSSIDYGKVPSQAFQKYKDAFMRNDESRFQKFIENNSKEIKSGTLFPYQLFRSYLLDKDPEVLKAQWNNLPNYIKDNDSFLPVCDVSGSMIGLPMDISVSLGVYLSEKNKSIFKDAFITFSSDPELVYLKGDIIEKFNQLGNSKWGFNTNIQGVFDLILNKAKTNKLSQEDLPKNILIISDMEFDEAISENSENFDNSFKNNEIANFKYIDKKFSEAGYKRPNLIFWNVNGRIGNVPVSKDNKNVALVSGASPSIMKFLLGGEDISPIGIMNKTLNSKRYEIIK